MLTSSADKQHPGSWWLFAALLATCIGSINQIVFTSTAIATSIVLVRRNSYSELAARNFRIIATAMAAFMAVRVLLQNLLGYPMGSHVIVELPSVQLPTWLAGIRIGGDITQESLVYAINDGSRIAGIAIAFAAIAAITSPTRILRALPLSLHSAGMLLVIAVTFLPHLLADISRVRNAARWRGQQLRGIRAVISQLINVAESALDRSVTLAAALTVRGYSHSSASTKTRSGLLIGSMLLVTFVTSTMLFGANFVTSTGAVLSLIVMWFSLVDSTEQITRTRYRESRWAARDYAVIALPCAMYLVAMSMPNVGHFVAAVMLTAGVALMTINVHVSSRVVSS